jgi:Zn-dependent protease with chaperone function
MRRLAVVLLLLGLVRVGLVAQGSLPWPPDPAVIGPEAATQAYLATLPPDKKARSDAYFEGGYWLDLWDTLWSAGVFILLMYAGWSARLRDWAARIVRRRFLVPVLYWIAFLAITYVLSFPLSAYTGFFREHQYGLSTQTFGAWLFDDLKGLAISAVLGAILMAVLYAVLRRTGRSWWIWGAAVTIAFLAFFFTIAPVYLAPMFNTYQPLRDESIRGPILRMARANGIAASEVWEVDASRQTTRISANVSGMFGTERITLNDNLLKRASPAAIQAVMGHEMGHYVLNHGYKMLVSFSVLIAIGFGLIGWAYPRLAVRYRDRWHIGGIEDSAGLPLAALIMTLYLSVLTPVLNTIVRTSEYEADVFGLNAARQPDGFAEATLLLSDYRKLAPGPLEEIIFFDHPSGHTRIFTAMRWKAEKPR